MNNDKDQPGFHARGMNEARADKLKGLFRSVIGINKGTVNSSFTEEARKFRSVTGEPSAEHVPFNCYWPTYGSMDEMQAEWYFHWRRLVRTGEYPPTDLSYIFIHIYELINNVESDSPTQTLHSLCRLWNAYRDVYGRLDRYLVPWIEDYMLVNMHPLEASKNEAAGMADLSEWLREMGGERLANLFPDYAVGRYAGAGLEKMPVELLGQFSDYEFYNGMFFRQDAGDYMLRILPAAIARIDSFLNATRGAGIFEKYRPDPGQVRHRIPFSNAIYDGGVKSVEIPAAPYVRHEPLRTFLTSLIKVTENVLREKTGYKGRLKNLILEPDIETELKRFVADEYMRLTLVAGAESITIDREKIIRLINDSNTVRIMLSQDIKEEPEPATCEPEQVKAAEPEKAETQKFTPKQRKILKLIAKSGGRLEEAQIAARVEGAFLQVEMDLINETAMDLYGDIVLTEEDGFWVLSEEYMEGQGGGLDGGD